MAVVEVLRCRFCRSDFEREVTRGPKPNRCQACAEAGLVTAIAGPVQAAEQIRSANPDIEGAFLWRHGKPIHRGQVAAFNKALLDRRWADTRAKVTRGFAATG